ncbi:MAG: DNA repair protein RecN [Rectinemataceae bacterium]|nr:DNA repair protein RecN [Rectinemataceae bacterium]
MLEELSVRDFALIDSLSLQFSSGFNILTGETGTGKSLLIGALSFLLGAKSDTAILRSGTDECVVTGIIDISAIPAALSWLIGHDIAHDDCRIVIRRGLKASGRSYIYLQGQAISRPDLQSLTSLLVDIHGQHEHQNLLIPDNHRVLLDRFSGAEKILDIYSDTYRQLQNLVSSREKAEKEIQQRLRESDFLEFQLHEIESAKLREGEKEQLETEENILTQHEKLFAAIETVHAGLSLSGDNTNPSLRKARSALEAAAGIDPRLNENAKRLTDAFYEVEDIADNMSSYRDTLSFDPQRLEWIESRLAEIHRFEKKYSNSVAGILRLAESHRTKLSATENWDAERAEMDSRIEELKKELARRGRELSDRRQKASVQLASSIESIIHTVGMPNTGFMVSVSVKMNEKGETVFGSHGCDEVEFMISPNPGSPFRPLVRIASGGELSRVALAIRTVLAGLDTVETLIFDEIDTGIGGEAAASVGRHLRELGKDRQVLCITHLASIASMATTQFRVEKEVVDGNKVTKIKPLTGRDRTAEIARMLAGDQEEEASLVHAAELLKKNGLAS